MEQLIPQFIDRITENEYLRMEEAARFKHEFRDGKIIDMAGGTSGHAGIALNIGGELRTRLKGSPCKAFGSDLRVRINERGNYCYPDVTVVCGPLEYDRPGTTTTVTNPRVIIEVSSPSTAADDRGDKFNDYRLIESLEEYILVSQDRARVETFYRQSDGIWAFGPAWVGLNQSVKFRTLGIEIPLAEIYAGIEFPAAPPKPDPV